ncbi:Eco57I restriction-modification methylase domain-containing protein [Fusibacter ferrireducens]|uniref:Eco57I restriction-modification methylase domain-containing protein n=1 Tax=Fusibacter ferrireducens TaxID=2785058 RepID=UPI001A9C0D24|nr:N-6 DNA methylase [Fusibacter ferrireducens]
MSINIKCQVFTPIEYVQQLLDYAGYNNNLYNQKVAENSCGDGNILGEIVVRYINDCKNNHLDNVQIKLGLERDIYAAEIDQEHIDNCTVRLDSIANEYDIHDVNWNFYHGDFLKLNIQDEFDYVIGNPPYITYKEISLENRSFLRENFETCYHGKFDYCYAFIEASVKSLRNNGRLVYLVPSNIFKNQFAHALRDYLVDDLTDIYDFTSQKLFKNKQTASAIMVFEKNSRNQHLLYHDIMKNSSRHIIKNQLVDKWQFQSVDNGNTVKFGEMFHAASCIATLLNEVYLIRSYTDNHNYLEVENGKIEKSILRRAISPRSKRYNKEEYIIFPYDYQEGRLLRYTEGQFMAEYPLTAQYMLKFAEKLSKRDSDNGIAWFEYGRSQALAHLNQSKLLLSTLVTNQVNVYELGIEEIPTSGIYIVSKENEDLSIARRILESPEFYEYAKSIGVISNYNSYRIAPKDINNFQVPVKYLKK